MPMQWSEKIVVCDLRDEPELSEELNELHAELAQRKDTDVPNVILNMDAVSYVNSSNIAQLLRVRRRLLETKQSMRLAAVADGVWSIMLLTGLDKVFDFAPDKATAIAGFQIDNGDQA